MYAFGDILIINFPFSDGVGSKRRPVMVVKDTADGDLLVAKVTSQQYHSAFDVSLTGWASANLITPSVVRVHKIQTIYVGLIFGHVGRLVNIDRFAIRQSLANLFAAS